MKLTELDINALLASPLGEDPTAIAMAKVLTPILRQLARDVISVLMLPRVAELDEGLLDELAWDLCVKWYEKTADLAAKRQIIADSDRVHRRMGTPDAVERVAKAYFGTAEVEEWWTYGGDAYCFRVRTNNVAAGIHHRRAFYRAVEQTKNLRSAFEGIMIDAKSGDIPLYAGCLVQSTRDIIIPIGG